MEEIGSIGEKTKNNTVFEDEEHILHNRGKLVSVVKLTKHLVYQTSNKNSARKEYSFVNPNTRRVDVQVDGYEHNKVLSRILMKANKDNTLSTTNALYHLLTHHSHSNVLDFDTITPAGAGVIAKLTRVYNNKIASHGYDPVEKRAINITAQDVEYTQAKACKGNSEDQALAKRMHVVFFKK